MPIQLEGFGPTKNVAGVDNAGRILSRATSESLQHFNSREYGRAFQAWGTATLANGTVTVLHMKNDSADKNMVVSFIRINVVSPSGGTALPNNTNYFEVAYDRLYSSGGSAVTPINTNRGSTNVSNVTAYDSGPTLTGTAVVVDRHYATAGTELTYDKQSSTIIAPGKTLEIRFTGDHTAGTAYARVSFIMQDTDL